MTAYNSLQHIQYTNGREKGRLAIAESDRARLARLARASKGSLVSVSAAAQALGIDRRAASLLLASLTRRGWLQRARRGLYLILPLESEPGHPAVSEDPWVLAHEAFSPCYIGGWSAAEHWGLTEQIFRSTLVVTAASVRAKSRTLLGHEFRLFHVSPDRISGSLTSLWRGTERVLLSSRERTLADCLRDPELCGGIRHLFQLLQEYGRTPDCDFEKLADVTEEAASGAAWKRLGYLAELLWPAERALVDRARKGMSSGNARLDPALKRRGSLLRRWRLWINITLEPETPGSPS